MIIKKLVPFILVLAISSYFIISSFDSNNSFSYQVKSLNSFQSQNIEKRLFLWENTFRMIEDNSIFGVGSGNWKTNIPKYTKDGEHNNFGEIRYQTPHNDYLSLFAENSIFGLLLYLSILILSIFYCIKLIRKSKSKDDKVFTLLVFGGITSYIIISVFSATKEYFETLFFLSILLSFVIVGNARITDSKKHYRTLFIFIPLFLIAACASSTVYMFKVYKSEMHTKLAVNYINNNEPELCISEISKAYSVITSCDPTGTPLKWYKGNANFVLGKYVNAQSDYENAYKLAPYNSFILTNIASTYAITQKYEKAEKFYKLSLSIKPNNQQVINNLIIINIQQNRIDEAFNICLKQSYENEGSQYHNLFLITLKHRVNNAINIVDENEIKHILSARKDDKYWLWLFQTNRKIYSSQKNFNKSVILDAIEQLANEWTITPHQKKLLLEKYSVL